MENIPQSRRRFITTVALTCTGLGALWRFLTPDVPHRRRVLLRAPLADVPPNGALVLREQRLALLRGEGGVYALSLVCTHLGCTVTVSAQELACPCHGSRFDRYGNVMSGPADRPLNRLTVEIREGTVEVLA